MEDLLECIFGEILSPSEVLREREVSLERTGTHEHRIDAAMTIRQFNRLIGASMTTDSAETVGGLLLHVFGEIPREAARIVVGEYEFEVERVSSQRIAEVTVRPVPAPEAGAGSTAGVETADLPDVAHEPDSSQATE